MGDHKPRGATKDNFCGTAPYGTACQDGQKFRTTGKPSPWFFPYQAHHLLPVSCVQHEVIEIDAIDSVLRDTTWCINKKRNMLGMPIWGPTVKWYMVQHKASDSLSLVAPPFANIPQHLVDHDLYNTEVDGKLQALVSNWKVLKKDHELEPKDIKDDLGNTSSAMRRVLKRRGQGSHKAWVKAVKKYTSGGEHPTWYKPFSMASAPRPRPFPIRVKEGHSRAWSAIKKIANALSR